MSLTAAGTAANIARRAFAAAGTATCMARHTFSRGRHGRVCCAKGRRRAGGG
jgi:hypothetical protein